MTIASSLVMLESDNLITSKEYALASLAEDAGYDGHTIGYEVEVLGSAREDIPNIRPGDSAQTAFRNAAAVKRYSYGVSPEGQYELQSPAARHPLALQIATRGIVRAGWLPDRTKGVVTAHVSIGTAESQAHLEHNSIRLVNLLRTVELLGNTTPSRLLAPTRPHPDGSSRLSSYWNCRGTAGLSFTESQKLWEGKNNRVEFRTLGFYSPGQFGGVLDSVYFLSQALLAPRETPLGAEYAGLETDTEEYFSENKLPAVEPELLDRPDEEALLAEYIAPYAAHLATADRSAFKARVLATVENIKEELGMQAAA
jgi:hypothetical protein